MKGYYFILCCCCCFAACKKSGFLGAKPDAALVVPTTLNDFQALLDNDQVMNGAGNQGVLPALGEVASDDYFLLNNDYNGPMPPLYRNCYIWAKQLYSGEELYDWDYPYRAVFYSNIVLEGLAKLSAPINDPAAINNAKGTALFYRSYMFYALSQVFAPSYDSLSAATAPGIPLRLHSDINEPIQRSSVQKTYQQIIADLTSSISLLPDNSLYKSRPCKAAAYGLLARTYLVMQDYAKAQLYADSCLQKQATLIDYNTLGTSVHPIPRFNNEVIFNCTLLAPRPISYSNADTALYTSYDSSDLRKKMFFHTYHGLAYFTGSYDGSFNPFGGIATDEMYLIRSESAARAGNTKAALADLNQLLLKRWKTGSFIPVNTNSVDTALAVILKERRKELIFRGLRWTDLRRLNKNPLTARTIQRLVNGQLYSLPPNDPRYMYPLPDNVIKLNPGMPNNPR